MLTLNTPEYNVTGMCFVTRSILKWWALSWKRNVLRCLCFWHLAEGSNEPSRILFPSAACAPLIVLPTKLSQRITVGSTDFEVYGRTHPFSFRSQTRRDFSRFPQTHRLSRVSGHRTGFVSGVYPRCRKLIKHNCKKMRKNRAPRINKTLIPYALPVLCVISLPLPRCRYLFAPLPLQKPVSVESGLRGFGKYEGEFLALPIGAERFHDTPGERHVGL